MAIFDIQFASFALLIFTALLSAQTHVFQTRTGIRESIEQLDDVVLGSEAKAKPILHRFTYVPRKWPELLYGETQLLMKFYGLEYNETVASDPNRRVLSWLSEEEDFFKAVTNSIDGVKQVQIVEGGFRVDCQTRNAVEARRIADRVSTHVRKSYENRNQ